MNKDKKIIIIGVAIMIFLILAFGFVMMKIIKENRRCVDNPFLYGTKSAYENKGIMMTCSCYPEGYSAFWFNHEEISYEAPFVNLNLSE